MESLADILSKRESNLPKGRVQGAPRNERDEQVDEILKRINESRKLGKVKEMPRLQLLKLLTGLDWNQLYALRKECEGAERFEGLLKWKIKNKQT